MFHAYFVFLFLLICAPAFAQENPENRALNDVPFGMWAGQFVADAKAQGISEDLLKRAFHGLEPDEDVVRLDRKQPEGTKTFTQYLRDVVNKNRIDQGRQKYLEHKPLLEKIGAQYGVQPRFIVALWGIETNYGGYTGNSETIRSLATLAYEGRRAEFFRDELLKALRIIDEGHISLEDMRGSWAGAMGQCQFMPSSFLNFAVDYNGDGHKDIWNTQEDVFASIANYLKQSGWSDQLTWGRKVKIPQGFDVNLADKTTYRSLAEWSRLGVLDGDGSLLPDKPLEAALMLPGTPQESAYLGYRNYDVILKWNRSRYFATAVGTLSDHLQD